MKLSGWAWFAVLVLIAPLAVSKGFALSLLSRIAIMAVFALSYNMLLGQTGLLSFGHAVYYGLGSFATLHLLNAFAARGIAAPVTLLPLFGGLASLAFGLVFGYVTTRRAGTTFAMISLGIGEMVAASSLMFPAFFGGEAGISGNRVTGKGLFGIDYGTPLQMYYLIAAWMMACVFLIRALSHTPLGRLANAVRDNPSRLEFLGYNPQKIRWLMVVLAGFFAGVAGGLNALRAEIVTAEALSDYTSGIVILMAFVGGIGTFYGPMLGALVVTLLQVAVASVTPAWPFYFGLFFVLIVLYAPGGISSLIVRVEQAFHAAALGRLLPVYLLSAVPAALVLFGVVGTVEMAYARGAERGDAQLRLLGIPLDGANVLSWLLVGAMLVLGSLLWRRARKAVAVRWDALQPPSPPARTGLP
jgi:branched-chain amino acid transport system permease protein